MRQSFKRLVQRIFKRPFKRLFKSKRNRRTPSPNQATSNLSTNPSTDPERASIPPPPLPLTAPSTTPPSLPPTTPPTALPLVPPPSLPSSPAPLTNSNDSQSVRPSPPNTLLKTVGKATVLGLELIKETIDGIPILHSLKGPIQGVLEVVDIIKAKRDVDDELDKLDARVGELQMRIFNPLREKQAVEIPADLRKRLLDFGSEIEIVVEGAQSIKDQGTISASVNASENTEILGRLNSKISELLNYFNADNQISLILKLHLDDLKKNVKELPHAYAAYNSTQDASTAKQTLRRMCLPNTAEKILKQINEWIDSDSEPNVLVVHGLAGVGKSTIAQTIAESRDPLDPRNNSDPQNTKRKLGASFFFVRNVNDNPDTFFPTIAFQLVDHFPESYSFLNGQYIMNWHPRADLLAPLGSPGL